MSMKSNKNTTIDTKELTNGADKSSKLSKIPLRIRRSTSAPPPSTRRRLIEDYYRLDETKSIVLPGLPKQEDDWPRDAHDFFNLVVLIPVIVLNVMNWDWDALLDMPKGKSFEDAWTGEWFNIFYFYTQSYFALDLIWVILVPDCVRSPTTIIQHHIATIFYMAIPYFFPEMRYLMGALLTVELNTWFLIARRVFNKQGFPPWTIDLPPIISIRIKLISICFYTTWIIIRCIIYPAIFGAFFYLHQKRAVQVGTRWNVFLICIPLHSCFVVLNIKWTYDLLMSKVRYWRRKGKGNKKEYISKGL